jgi:hypothetical protein
MKLPAVALDAPVSLRHCSRLCSTIANRVVHQPFLVQGFTTTSCFVVVGILLARLDRLKLGAAGLEGVFLAGFGLRRRPSRQRTTILSLRLSYGGRTICCPAMRKRKRSARP